METPQITHYLKQGALASHPLSQPSSDWLPLANRRFDHISGIHSE